MCLIIDANLAATVFGPSDARFAPLLRWLEGKGCLVFGGKLTEELARVGSARRYLVELYRAGRARKIEPADLRAEEARIEAIGGLRSNDTHVLALARASGARTLCSHDKNLHLDFKNRQLIDHPPGAIYQKATKRNRHLLRHTRSCGR
jgi:predicted nucleic acid-binding protein